MAPVCTENVVRFDLQIESLNVRCDGRADILPLERYAVGSGSQTAIAYSSSSCIAGFHQS